MTFANNKKKVTAFVVAGLFIVTGTYNSVVINSESDLARIDARFVKRLDEIHGVTVAGREVAASVSWQKLTPSKVIAQKQQIAHRVSKVESAPTSAPSVDVVPAAAVQEELTLSLVEVINPKKWQNGLPSGQFNGSLSTNQGIIEELSVALPNGEGVSVSFSEMAGNVFEYDLNGELYSGMMYQVDQNAYMVTLTNGPLEGTRLRFSSSTPQEEQVQTQEVLAESNVEVGNFGQEQMAEAGHAEVAQADQPISYEQMIQNDQMMQQEAMQAQGFNFDQAQPL